MDRLPVSSFQTRPLELRGFADDLAVEPAEEADGGWLLSFVDILTLLLTLFVLLLAISHTQHHDPAGAPRASVAHRPVPVSTRATPGPTPIPVPRSAASGPAASKHPPAIRPATPVSAPVHPASPSSSTAPPKGTSKPALAATAPAPTPTVAAQPHRAIAKHAPPAFLLPKNLSGQVQMIASANRVNLVIKDDVLFAPGNASLQPAGRGLLARIARLLRRDRDQIAVEGYTDNTPIHTARFPSNWELSTARATAVTRFLIAQGIVSDRLRAIGYGATRPRASNATAAGRALNRRVSLVVHLNKNPGISRNSAAAKNSQ